MKILSEGKRQTEEEKRIDREYEIRDGRLFRKDNDRLLWVVPKKVRWQIVKKCHDDLGHPAYAKTLNKAKEQYWWPRMRNYVKGYIGSCLECLYNKVPGGKQQGKLHSIDKIGIPFHTIHIDHLGPFVKSKKGYSYILVIIDGFTKFTLLKPVRDTTSQSSAKILEELIYIFGPPYRIISDRGTSFTGTSFRNLCKQKKIIHILNATSTARANGQVERINRVITTALASLITLDDGRDWDKHIGRLQWSINNTHHQAIKCTPFSLLFNFDPRTLDGDPLQDELNKNKLLHKDIEDRRMNAIEDIRKDQKKQRDRYNRRRAKANNYEPGDLIMVRRQVPSTGESTKLMNKYAGPYVVTEKLPFDRYRIEDMPEIQRSQRFYRGVAPVDALKHCKICINEKSDASEDDDGEETERESKEPKIRIMKSKIPKEAIERKRQQSKPKYLEDYIC